jgi:hypothetical protein
MALQFLTGLNVDGNSSFSGYIDLNKNELQNAVIQNLATAPGSPVEGQVYYDSSVGDKQLYFYNGTSWIPVSGDIQEVIAGDGLTGGGNSGSITLDVGAGTGITVNANDIAITNTGVTADIYGSTTAIPVITVNAQGQITSASEASIQTSFDITDGSTTETVNGGDTITFSGTTNEVEVAVSATDTVTIGLPSDVTIGNDLTVLGDLQVTGTTTTNNVETVSTSNGVIFEGNVADANELTLIAGTLTADRTVTLPDATGTVALLDDITGRTFSATIGNNTDTSFTVTHNLGTKDVIVQLYDLSSNDTVYADVVRTSTSVVTVSFGTAPATNDIRVLVSKIG